jgi:hypothetical protein
LKLNAEAASNVLLTDKSEEMNSPDGKNGEYQAVIRGINESKDIDFSAIDSKSRSRPSNVHQSVDFALLRG